jgi:hypothetical protein
MGRGRRNREYDEIVRDSGVLRAKELHENKQARLEKKKAKLQAEIETVDAEMIADKADFAEKVPQDLLPVSEPENEAHEDHESPETSETSEADAEAFEAVGTETE